MGEPAVASGCSVTGRRRPILGYALFAGDAERCADSIAAWIEQGDRARWLACLNPHSYVVGLERPEFARALAAADWLVADGTGIVIASRVLRAGIDTRVTGSDVFEALSRRLERRGANVFFLGASQETLDLVRARYAREYPRLRVVGTLAPPYKAEFSAAELDAMVAAVNASRADVLWVGLGAPKQELWIHALRERLDVRFAAAIGGAFDFYAGRIKRAHPLVRRLGLEWLPRLAQEPRRLWRRMGVSAPVFVWHVMRARLGRR